MKKIILEIPGFIFYLYEVYNFFTVPKIVSIYDGSSEIFFLRLIILLLALPLLYLFRLAYYFDWGGVLSSALSGIFKFDSKNTFFQVKLFYYAIYILLSILLFFKAVDYIYKFL